MASKPRLSNLPTKLAEEIARVAELRALYRREVPAAGAIAVSMMTGALDQAFRAAGSGDIVEMIAAVKELEGFTD